MKLLRPKNDSCGPEFRVVLVFAEVQWVIYEVHMNDFFVSVFSYLNRQMTNVSVCSTPRCVPLKHGVKNTTITMFYIVKEGFCREVKVTIR